MDASLERWQKEMEPFKGAPIVPYHKNFIYFIDRFGLREFETSSPNPAFRRLRVTLPSWLRR
jgi:hypothetical protein